MTTVIRLAMLIGFLVACVLMPLAAFQGHWTEAIFWLLCLKMLADSLMEPFRPNRPNRST